MILNRIDLFGTHFYAVISYRWGSDYELAAIIPNSETNFKFASAGGVTDYGRRPPFLCNYPLSSTVINKHSPNFGGNGMTSVNQYDNKFIWFKSGFSSGNFKHKIHV